jgi:hypothetical protein
MGLHGLLQGQLLQSGDYDQYSKCHVTSNKAKSNFQCAEEKFQTRGWVRYTYGFSIGRTSVKKLHPPQAMRGILLGMRDLVRSYVTLAILSYEA